MLLLAFQKVVGCGSVRIVEPGRGGNVSAAAIVCYFPLVTYQDFDNIVSVFLQAVVVSVRGIVE